jgi:hypothetical protein
MDAPRLSLEVQIGGARDDPRVARLLHVKSHEMAPVPRQNRPTIGRCNPEDFSVNGTPVRQSRLASRRSIMAEPA